ncbi:MAG TPA: prephenate dehydratase [Thermoleophilaceae bacterium]
MRVAFLGPAGTYAEEALRASTPEDVEEIPHPTVYEAVMAVQDGDADRAVVPIENSLEGSVSATLDVLAAEATGVRIAAEVDLPIHHCLIARDSTELGAIERVLSHPQATAQCARFLRERLPDAERTSTPSTAEAVRMVAAEDRPWAALGSRFAAELYGCQVLDEQVADSEDNVTRFVWLAPSAEPADPDATKTSIVFWGFNDQSPGALVDVLRELADRNINLTKIESRPRRVQLGHYMFFADLDGAEHEPVIREALEGLRTRVETLRVLGSYSAIAAR